MYPRYWSAVIWWAVGCCCFLPSATSFLPSCSQVESCYLSELTAVSRTQKAALDGAEWASVQSFLLATEKKESSSKRPLSQVGYMTVVTGTNDVDKTRVVGIQAPDSQGDVVSLAPNVYIYKSSMATIPNDVSDQDAITTLIASLASVHCTLPRLEGVGGATTQSFVAGKVVVLGGSDYALFAAEGLAVLGAKVYLVSTKKPRVKNTNIEVMEPAVGELELGFANVVGEFDALLDTMSDEARLGGPVVAMNSYADDDEEEEEDEQTFLGSGVVAELRRQHNCHQYVSTLSMAQRIVRDKGLFFGPKEADQHLGAVGMVLSSKPGNDFTAVVPPRDFSNTLQTLLDNKVTYSWKFKSVAARTWSLSDFWELASWPRDSAGGANVRFGLPVIDDLVSLDDERLIAEPPAFSNPRFQKEREEEAKAEAAEANPYVLDIVGVEGLQKEIVGAEKDCLLFLSAPYCRTCRYLTPQYNRMARLLSEKLTFAKANASGTIGKALGKALEVDAVPAFVLFRQGRLYGSPLSVSRLPSKKLERAVEYLSSGKEWDSSLLREEKER